ncbi:hypothetical protein ABID25_003841 [Mesorhizobium abyssinicae]
MNLIRSEKKAGKVPLAGLPHPPVAGSPYQNDPRLKGTGRYCHYRLPPSAEARRTSDRNSDL